MKDAADWLAFYRQFWEQRLDRLEDYVAELQAKEEENERTRRRAPRQRRRDPA